MKSFDKHLNQLRKDLFDAAFDPDVCGFATVNELAEASNLSWATVDNLYRGVTKDPRHRTIYKLAIAIKMDLELVGESLGRSVQHKVNRKKRVAA